MRLIPSNRCCFPCNKKQPWWKSEPQVKQASSLGKWSLGKLHSKGDEHHNRFNPPRFIGYPHVVWWSPDWLRKSWLSTSPMAVVVSWYGKCCCLHLHWFLAKSWFKVAQSMIWVRLKNLCTPKSYRHANKLGLNSKCQTCPYHIIGIHWLHPIVGFRRFLTQLIKYHNWLVVSTLWKIWVRGMIIPNIWKNNKCSKPPTR
jgi:hypothetical protein